MTKSAPVRPTPAKKETRKDAPLSIVTPDMHVLGNIVSEGLIDFEGKLDGNIRCHVLTVRPGGVIKGEITADMLYVYGKINGIIRSSHVQLHSGCHVEGVVMHQTLIMEDGAFLDGKCKRMDKVTEPEEVDNSTSPFDYNNDEPIANIPMLENIRLIRS